MEAKDFQDVLKPFYQRASETENRVARLEASLAIKQASVGGNEELVKMVTELKSKLEDVKAERVLERKKDLEEIEKLRTENAKLKYRVTHLVRAVQEGDSKLESKNEIEESMQKDLEPSVQKKESLKHERFQCSNDLGFVSFI